MKNNIKKILNAALSKREFKNVEFNLVINDNNIFYNKKLNDKTNELFNNIFEKIDNINTFTFTIVIKENYDSENYNEKSWKKSNFIIYGGLLTGSQKLKDYNKYCRFDFDSIGARGENHFNNILSKPFNNSRIFGNVIEYDNVSNLLDMLLEYDCLLDKNYREQCNVIRNLWKEE